jgi:hypothetical protein
MTEVGRLLSDQKNGWEKNDWSEMASLERLQKWFISWGNEQYSMARRSDRMGNISGCHKVYSLSRSNLVKNPVPHTFEKHSQGTNSNLKRFGFLFREGGFYIY